MRRILSIPAAPAMASIAITFGVAPITASAAGLDGSANLVCAATHMVARTKASACGQGDESAFDLADFMFVDFKAKVVKARTRIASRSTITNQ